jgi:hypothetical protein
MFNAEMTTIEYSQAAACAGCRVARPTRFELLTPRFPASDHGLPVLGG